MSDQQYRKPDKRGNNTPRWSRYQSSRTAEGVSWAAIDADKLLAAVSTVTDRGHAVLLSLTRDGGAYVMTICADDQRLKLYSSTPADMEVHLVDVDKNIEL